MLRYSDICATIASSPLGKLTGQKHLQPSAKFSMRCGSSMTSLNERGPNSKRSGLSKRVRINACQPDRHSQHRTRAALMRDIAEPGLEPPFDRHDGRVEQNADRGEAEQRGKGQRRVDLGV